MQSISENLVRAAMNSVDIWRSIEKLEALGWNEQAIADALALPVRTIRRLKLLAHLPASMLDVMAAGSNPNEQHLRIIAAASPQEQAQVWKKHKPKKGAADVSWYEIANALQKRRIPFSMAKFGDDLARAYGIVWEDDLFAPAGEDGRYTTNVDGFFGAQQEWMQSQLPAGASIAKLDQYGRPELPKKAEMVYGKPHKSDHVSYYVDQQSGEVKTVAYRMPEPKKPAKPVKAGSGDKSGETTESDAPEMPSARTRADISQMGVSMIGGFRTDALHQALTGAPIEDDTLLGLLILAFGASNLSVQSAANVSGHDRRAICDTITEGGVLTADRDLLRQAARKMLVGVLSCQENAFNSGVVARVAGVTLGADTLLPNMATEDFLKCLSKSAIEKVATAEGVRVEVRGKDTRARVVERFKTGRYVHPAAGFAMTEAELTKARTRSVYVPGAGNDDDVDPDTAGNDGFDEPTDTADELEHGDFAIAAE
jgi:ParB family chromosome partitioning protein